MVGQADTPALLDHLSLDGHGVQDLQQRPVVEQEAPGPAMSRRPAGRHRAGRGDQGIGAEVRAQRLAAMQVAQGAQQPALGKMALAVVG